MSSFLRTAALSALFVLASGVLATAAPTTVKVALLDMTASNQNIAGGPGMMGQGGPGMMDGRGFGMMGGQGMMGRGFGNGMGPGMMSIGVDTDSVKAGEVTFDVTNWSRTLVHEMLVVAVDNPQARLPYDSDDQRIVEEKINSLGETEEMEPKTSKTLTLDLKPGTYLLLCNIAGHYAAGMWTVLTVTQ